MHKVTVILPFGLLYSSSSQPGAISPTRGDLAMSEDILVVMTGEGNATSILLNIPRTASQNSYPTQNVSSSEDKKPYFTFTV